ncbi:hypothetical protein [Polyangium jinanense]|uniref:Uncharacterized protein n=1 Tax=Polyangium jinanense TaxID=2829994 RepID=A0A9X3X279_9BACT|nr:hypothetical protein [Polyangium jinanense]MDC3961099.1 hypothetical protein [Polyangium jinanense]MDC3982824.1 hypothetical protein [Polyangium jinanense]
MGGTVESLFEELAGTIETWAVPPSRIPGWTEPQRPWRATLDDALRVLSGDGRLARLDALGHPLVESLVAIATGPLWSFFAAPEGRNRALFELVQNLANPGRINQGLKGTCAAACLESYLAVQDPAEYARLVAGLISASGRATLRSGEELVCDEDILLPNVGERGRNPISRIFQVACMEFAYPDLDYDNILDSHFKGGERVGTGLEMGAFERLLVAVTGKPWKTLSTEHAMMAKAFAKLGISTEGVADLARDGLSILDQSTRKGEPVFATIVLPAVTSFQGDAGGEPIRHAEHKILVLSIDWENGCVHYDDPIDPRERWFEGADVRIEDEHGRCSMPIADFERLLGDISYREELWDRSLPRPAAGGRG